MVIFWKCVPKYLYIKIRLLHYFWAKNLWEYCLEHCLVRFWVLRFNLLLSSMSRIFFFKTQKVVEEILDRYKFFFNEMNLYNALYLFCIIVILILYFIFIRGWQLVILKNLNYRLNFRDFLKYSCNLKKIFNGYNVNL